MFPVGKLSETDLLALEKEYAHNGKEVGYFNGRVVIKENIQNEMPTPPDFNECKKNLIERLPAFFRCTQEDLSINKAISDVLLFSKIMSRFGEENVDKIDQDKLASAIDNGLIVQDILKETDEDNIFELVVLSKIERWNEVRKKIEGREELLQNNAFQEEPTELVSASHGYPAKSWYAWSAEGENFSSDFEHNDNQSNIIIKGVPFALTQSIDRDQTIALSGKKLQLSFEYMSDTEHDNNSCLILVRFKPPSPARRLIEVPKTLKACNRWTKVVYQLDLDYLTPEEKRDVIDSNLYVFSNHGSNIKREMRIRNVSLRATNYINNSDYEDGSGGFTEQQSGFPSNKWNSWAAENNKFSMYIERDGVQKTLRVSGKPFALTQEIDAAQARELVGKKVNVSYRYRSKKPFQGCVTVYATFKKPLDGNNRIIDAVPQYHKKINNFEDVSLELNLEGFSENEKNNINSIVLYPFSTDDKTELNDFEIRNIHLQQVVEDGDKEVHLEEESIDCYYRQLDSSQIELCDLFTGAVKDLQAYSEEKKKELIAKALLSNDIPEQDKAYWLAAFSGSELKGYVTSVIAEQIQKEEKANTTDKLSVPKTADTAVAKKEQVSFVGFANGGATCYANSALKSILLTYPQEELEKLGVDLTLQNIKDPYLHKSLPEINRIRKALYELSEIINNKKKGSANSETELDNLFRACCDYGKKQGGPFAGIFLADPAALKGIRFRQEDAEEFLTELLDVTGLRDIPSCQIGFRDNILQTALEATSPDGKPLVKENKTSVINETMLKISVVQEKTGAPLNSLQEAIDQHFHEETLATEERLQKNWDAVKQQVMVADVNKLDCFPLHLKIFQLDRTNLDPDPKMTKLIDDTNHLFNKPGTDVWVPIEDKSGDTYSVKFQPKAVVLHTGTYYNGHYKAAVAEGDTWRIHDDTTTNVRDGFPEPDQSFQPYLMVMARDKTVQPVLLKKKNNHPPNTPQHVQGTKQAGSVTDIKNPNHWLYESEPYPITDFDRKYFSEKQLKALERYREMYGARDKLPEKWFVDKKMAVEKLIDAVKRLDQQQTKVSAMLNGKGKYERFSTIESTPDGTRSPKQL